MKNYIYASSGLKPEKNFYGSKKKQHYCPVRFLLEKRDEIILKLTENLAYSDSDSLNFFNDLILIISKIKELRHSHIAQRETVKYLTCTLITFPYPLQIVFSTYIIKSITSEETYRDSFNFIVAFYSSDFPFPLPFNALSDHDLLIALNEEKEDKFELTPTSKSSLTFSCNLSQDNLSLLCRRMIRKQMINAISEHEFIYLFSSKLLHNNITTLYWKESISLCHEFLCRTVFLHSNFNYKQVNACIKFTGDQKMNSSFQNKSFYKKDDILNTLLDFSP
jgi:hypothetical protein